ncbi:Centrosomal protein of 95 kDa [Willisornis vidua]|uniref:Centrosomal protein of 95 kDa n=1 Tax=Willisornis vidua TaxID=1566151 RepID=A0ABQ9DRL9_9PASS|nr:Centrosomal protein of 95 kDa [Willisornis vidua]
MGSAERSDWVGVANELLRSCHINQQIKHLSECGADVFVGLYEAILGEKVPDFIATPRSQEDDAHNVQAVIDSLALDYLQVSLSHITGENIVKGEWESVRNLLEIFDGLLEYLTEVSESSSLTGAEANVLPNNDIPVASQEQLEGCAGQLTEHSILSSAEGSQPEYFILNCDTDCSESTSELIRLGDTAHSFSNREKEFPMPVLLLAQRDKGVEESEAFATLPRQFSESEREMEKEDGTAQVGPRDAQDIVTKVPLVHEPSTSASSSDEKLSLHVAQFTQTSRPESRYDNSTTDSPEDSLSQGTAEKQLPEQELHEASEKLSRRLNELDLMLKRALGEQSREEQRDEDNLSQHSDSVMDYGHRAAEQAQHQEDKLCGSGHIRTIRGQLRRERDERTRKAKMVTKAYEDELRIYEAREMFRLSRLREAIKEREQEYKENIFKEPPKTSQTVKAYSRKATPRAPKHSQWIPKRGTGKPKKADPMTIRDNELLEKLLEEFPSLHISHRTLNKLWQRQLAHTGHLQAAPGRAGPKLLNEVQQALKKHELLAAIIKRDQDHSKRLQDLRQRVGRQRWAQNKVTEKRQQVARARRYYEDYRVQLRAKMMRARTREERIFQKLFEEGLEIQKQRLRDLRAYAQEKRDEQRREHQNELLSMENYYKDQFSMLAEALSQEFQQIQTRKKAQAQMLQKSRRELRSKMEKEIQQLQAAILQSDDDTFFQELEADRLRSRLQMASFQYSQGHFL